MHVRTSVLVAAMTCLLVMSCEASSGRMASPPSSTSPADGRAGQGPYPVQIQGIRLDDRRLRLELSVCNDDPEHATFVETDAEVRIRATSDSKRYKGDCAEGTEVTLTRVVGARRIVDDFDGKTLSCSFDECVKPQAGGRTPRQLQVSRKVLRPFGPREPGSTSLRWVAPIWHPEDRYIDITYLPGCRRVAFVETKEEPRSVSIRVVKAGPLDKCGTVFRVRIPLTDPIGRRQIVHDTVGPT